MTELPTTAAEFYAARDNRTNAYTGVAPRYTTTKVLVTANADYLRTVAGQVALLVSANLLSRWCRHVSLELEDVRQIASPQGPSLRAAALALMRDADPFGSFVNGDEDTPDLHLHIGSSPPSANAQRLTVISSSGWVACVRRTPGGFAPGDESPVGAAAAGVLGGAQLFRDALEMDDIFPPCLLFDAFTGLPCTDFVEHPRLGSTALGQLLMVGAGSVGSATAYFMRLFGLVASLTITDADVVKVENFGRSPLFGCSNLGEPKVVAVEAALAGSQIATHAHPSWWHESPVRNLDNFDLVIPVANEYGVRWSLQTSIPPLMVHASTGKNWNVNFGRHVPGRDDCLVDRFSEFDAPVLPACSAGAVAIPSGEQVDAALPFLSFWAGFLAAADLARLTVAGYPHVPNFGNYSFRKNRFTPQQYDEHPREGCECTRQGAAFSAFRAGGRYRSLSPASW